VDTMIIKKINRHMKINQESICVYPFC